MTSIRLLPLVIVAASALFVLRGISVLSDGQLNAFGSGQTIAQEANSQLLPPENADEDGAETGESMEIAAATPEGTAGASPTEAAPNQSAATETQLQNAPDIPEFTREEIEALQRSGMSPAEIQVLTRLRERREKLASRERQLELRESMLKAMESSLQTKLNTLEQSGVATSVGPDGQPTAAEPNQRIQKLVKLYESMKPKDAARILSRIDTNLLADLARAMNPRKMSSVLAAMDSDAAERLTLALAGASSSSTDLSSLPQVGPNGLSR